MDVILSLWRKYTIPTSVPSRLLSPKGRAGGMGGNSLAVKSSKEMNGNTAAKKGIRRSGENAIHCGNAGEEHSPEHRPTPRQRFSLTIIEGSLSPAPHCHRVPI